MAEVMENDMENVTPMISVKAERGSNDAADRAVHTKSRKGYLMLRRLQDIVLSLVGLVLLLPLMLIIALLVVLDDPKGGPIFVQTRIGQDGKPFKMYKFRSMYVNAEEQLGTLLDQNEMDGLTFKMKNDPRITRVGRVIRKCSVDELPQLLNILRGDMSIVGPRPPLPREVEQYTPFHFQRLSVRPGLTCYWQIQPRRNDISFEEWVELDLKYIRERSFVTDWKIIFKTFQVVLSGEGE